MKKVSFLLTAIVAVIGLSFTGGSATYNVKTADSNVQWKAYKVTGEHLGVVNLRSGVLNYEDGVLKGGTFVIDMTTIKCLDLQGEWAGKLEGHLKSPDFFGVESHPTAQLVITNVVAKGTPGDYKVTGNLTIKQTTKEIKFYAHVDETATGLTATADIKVDRTDFDVRYGSGSFFDSLGDKTVYDEFDMTVKLVAAK